MYDLAIVGAGPAGTAAALRALQSRPDARVALVDASAFPRDKTCGDGIAHTALDVYAELGVTGLAEDYPPVSTLRIQSPHGFVTARPMSAPARVIPRLVFDDRLLRAALDRGAELIRRRVRSLDVRADRVVLDGDLAARVVVGADGANSVIRTLVGTAQRGRHTSALALRGYTSTAGPRADELLIAVSDLHCPAYAWSFPLPDGRANVGFGVFAKKVVGGKAELLGRLAAALPDEHLDPATVRAHPLPLSTGRPRLPDGRVLLVGDAAGLINPLTGEGIYYAAESGRLAADAAVHGAGAGARYRTALAGLLGRHHRHVGVLARLSRWPRFVDATMAAAIDHVRVFSCLAEIGLGRGVIDPAALALIAGRAARPLRRASS